TIGRAIPMKASVRGVRQHLTSFHGFGLALLCLALVFVGLVFGTASAAPPKTPRKPAKKEPKAPATAKQSKKTKAEQEPQTEEKTAEQAPQKPAEQPVFTIDDSDADVIAFQPLSMSAQPTSMALSEDGRFLVVTHQEAGSVTVWDAATRQMVKTL